MASSLTTFQRVFPNTELKSAPVVRVGVFAILSALLLMAQFGIFYLILDLFRHQGNVTLDQESAQSLLVLVGEAQPEETEQEQFTSERVELRDRGLLPTVAHTQFYPMKFFLSQLYDRIALFRDNNLTLLTLLGLSVVIGLLRSITVALARITAARVALTTTNTQRRHLHRQVMRLGPSDLTGKGLSRVQRLFLDDLEEFREHLTKLLFSWPINVATMVVLISIALFINWRLTLQCLFPLVVCWVLVQRERARSAVSRKLTAAHAEAQARLLAESLNKPRLVRSFGMESFEHEQFQKHLEQFESSSRQVQRNENFTFWASWMLLLICVTIVLFFIGLKALLRVEDPQHMSLADTFLLLACFAGMHRPLEGIRLLKQTKLECDNICDRLCVYYDQIPEVGQAVGAKFIDPLNKYLQFESVSYSLPRPMAKSLLNKFDVRIPKNSLTAVISTEPLEAKAVAYLIPRFIEPHSGRILIDGEDIAWATLESLRAEAIYVGGDDPFFTGSVMENILCGDQHFTPTKVTEAAKLTHAHNFISRLPDGYETVLGEHGEKLDVGEGFRLGLARAALRNPALLIVEEPEGPLDDDSKGLIDDAYQRLFPQRTVVVLPQRMSTLRQADRVILLHQGKIAATGTQLELLKTSELYRHWEYTQFNIFRHR